MNRDIVLDVLLRGRKFKRLVDDLYRDFRDRYGLKQAEVDVLVFLCEFPDRTPTEIAWELCMNKGHVSIATDGLCKKAYLLSERDAKDRRIVHFTVTEKGRTVNREILQIKDQVNACLFGGLTDHELDTLCAITAKLIAKIDELSEHCGRS